MRILGIDPGSTRIGYGLIESSGPRLIYKNHGCVFLEDKNPEERLLYVFKEMTELIKKTRPNIVSLEKVFFSKNKKTAIEVSEARGVIAVCVLVAGIKLYSYTPSEVKKSVTSYGQADKRGVQKMVKLLLGLNKEPKPDDAADALALAITAANNNPHKGY